MVLRGVHLLAPDAFELGAKTDAGSEPLAHCYVKTERATLGAERIFVHAMLLRAVEGVSIHTNAYEPVSPEGVGCNTVLLNRHFSVLCHSGSGGEAHKSQGNHQFFHNVMI